jgi:hypothetical protein
MIVMKDIALKDIAMKDTAIAMEKTARSTATIQLAAFHKFQPGQP